ncbi:SCO family protein [Kaistella jeonii]|uniref:Photosynthetic protein synthase I n=1 Tax=Kaistella jeonii TaxID=266749 RepID=A0A0C1FAQ7_9FLAO|nr:SCO family protein [Kaistella jeonii]KIA90222.1 photosynthetic protein synthase I [Kaistella jeonii]SFB87922.1 protein SCO1/2 [Kaistella jeonii]VEI95935.1 BsSco [Kaistella jeonii]
MKNFIILIFSVLLLFACKDNSEKPEEIKAKTTDSIFLLDSKWQNQDGKEIQLKDLKGKNLVVVMIFTSCQTACPLLVADMKKVEGKITKDKLKNTSMVLITIDPTNDTPEVLKKYAQKRDMYGEPWVFLRSDLESTREFANVLAVKYKKITPIIFSHSNIISIFNKKGEMVSQEEGTVNSDAIAKTVNGLN